MRPNMGPQAASTVPADKLASPGQMMAPSDYQPPDSSFDIQRVTMPSTSCFNPNNSSSRLDIGRQSAIYDPVTSI